MKVILEKLYEWEEYDKVIDDHFTYHEPETNGPTLPQEDADW